MTAFDTANPAEFVDWLCPLRRLRPAAPRRQLVRATWIGFAVVGFLAFSGQPGESANLVPGDRFRPPPPEALQPPPEPEPEVERPLVRRAPVRPSVSHPVRRPPPAARPAGDSSVQF